MKSRDRILKRLRAAAGSTKAERVSSVPDSAVFADFPEDDLQARIDRFGEKLRALSGEFFCVENMADASKKLTDLLESVEKPLVQNTAFLQEIVAQNPDLQSRCEMSSENFVEGVALEKFDCGITEVDHLIARTGSVVLNSKSAGGRRLSVLPPFHIAVARASQLIPSLEKAFTDLQENGESWSYATVITGPSRTADIQKNLVLGAHGPKRLAVILVKSDF